VVDVLASRKASTPRLALGTPVAAGVTRVSHGSASWRTARITFGSDGRLVPQTPRRAYPWSEITAEAVNALARIHEGDRAAIQNYTERYGLLYADGDKRNTERDLYAHAALIRELMEAQRQLQLVQGGSFDETMLEKRYAADIRKPGGWLAHYRSQYRAAVGRDPEIATLLHFAVAATVTDELAGANATHALAPDAAFGTYYHVVSVSDLCGYLYFLVATLLHERVRLRECPDCGALIDDKRGLRQRCAKCAKKLRQQRWRAGLKKKAKARAKK
jgi:hypothetical protein